MCSMPMPSGQSTSNRGRLDDRRSRLERRRELHRLARTPPTSPSTTRRASRPTDYLYFVDNGNIRRTDPATGATTTVFAGGLTVPGGQLHFAHRGCRRQPLRHRLDDGYVNGSFGVWSSRSTRRHGIDSRRSIGAYGCGRARSPRMPRGLLPRRERHLDSPTRSSSTARPLSPPPISPTTTTLSLPRATTSTP